MVKIPLDDLLQEGVRATLFPEEMEEKQGNNPRAKDKLREEVEPMLEELQRAPEEPEFPLSRRLEPRDSGLP